MIPRFFIDRPIFAAVLSIVIVIVGIVAVVKLPIAQYPEVAPPTISITSPTANAVLATGPVAIQADAGDTDGLVDHVDFFVDGVEIDTDTTAPYATSWSATAGPHTLTAVVYDDLDAQTTSLAVPVTVNPPLTGRARLPIQPRNRMQRS